MKKRVLVASNRGPVSYQFGRGRRGDRPGAAAGAWSRGWARGWRRWRRRPTSPGSARRSATRTAPQRASGRPARPSPQEPGDVPVRMLDIPPDTFERAYNNVANSVLWFVQHLLFDTPNEPRFGREFHRDWDAYLAYNEAFADAMADEARWDEAPPAQLPRADPGLPPQPGAPAAAGQARRGRPQAGIAHFSHTPWAPPDYYRMLPAEVSEAVLDGMLGADQVGFHRRPVGRRVPGLLRGDPGRAGEPGRSAPWPARAGRLPRARHRGGREPAGGGRPRAAGPRPGRRRAGACRGPQPGGPGPETDRQGRPDRAVQEHRARPGRVPRTARQPAGVARPGGPPGVRLPVPVRAARVPRLHRADASGRGGDQRGVRHAGLESADPRGQGRLPPVARRLRGWPMCCW